MIGRSWDLALAVCFALMIAGVENADELPQTENLTLTRKPDLFSVTAKWSRPTGLDEECQVNYTVEMYLEKCPPSSTETPWYKDRRQTLSLQHTWRVPNQSEICVIIWTNPMHCGNKKPSKPVHASISTDPALVKNFSCVYYSDMKMNCTWSVIDSASVLQLSYRTNDSVSLKPCTSYLTKRNMTGCHVDDVNLDSENIFFKISKTLDGSEISNTFIIEPRKSVKPEQPSITIERKGELLTLTSSTPNFSHQCWRYKFIYSQCDEQKESEIDAITLQLDYNKACQYKAEVQTIFTSNCGKESFSDRSEPVIYGNTQDLNRDFIIAMIVVPLVVSCCLIVALILFRRYKDIILPTIPKPSLLLKDFMNSSNDGPQFKSLYVPINEVVEQDIRVEPTTACILSNP